MNYVGFRGIRSAGAFCKAVAPKRSGDGWRVRTYTTPQSVASFVAGGGIPMTLVYDNGELPVVDANGKVIATPEALAHLARLLSDNEARVLQLFGVDLSALAAYEQDDHDMRPPTEDETLCLARKESNEP